MQSRVPRQADQTKQEQAKTVQQPRQLAGEQRVAFVDNRPEVAEVMLQVMMHNSPRAREGRALQAMMNNSHQASKAQALQLMANSSARGNPQLPGAAVMPVQRIEEEEPFQAKAASENTTQREAVTEVPILNNTGLPGNLKAGIESMSGMNMDHVKVHYNSDKPAQLNAHAYAQGSDIHVAPGQEQHLPHEAWHVVQQAQGRVKPTMQMKMGVPVNDDAGLEKEADLMGEKAAASRKHHSSSFIQRRAVPDKGKSVGVVQRLPNVGNAADYDAGVPNYIAGAFASTAASVQTTRANHNGASQPADPVNSNHIRGNHWIGDDYQAGGGLALTVAGAAGIQAVVPAYGPTELWIQGGISAGAAGNQLTRVHIIHHALGAGTNNNGQNIFWGNPGLNNPQILEEETRMLNFLNGGPPILNGAGTTLANDYYAADILNYVVAHNGIWYTPANSRLPAKLGGYIANGLYATINAAFGNANLQYCQVDPNVVPRTGTYQMTVNYGQHNNANMQNALTNAMALEYNNRGNARWAGENNAQVLFTFGQVLAEAQGSISSQVTVTQQHEEMVWNDANNIPALPYSAIPISQASAWNNVDNFNNIVLDNHSPRFRLVCVYEDANGAQIEGAPNLYNW